MERTARCGGGKAASIGLLTLGLSGCASAQNPPGGPPDFAPPVLLAVRPDSGTINPDFDGELRFEFDEVINERSGNGLANLFQFSPRDDELRVRWHRNSIGLEPGDGWRPNTVYHVRLDSGITDLRNNRLGEGRNVIFTTGGEIPDTRISGIVLDWEAGRPAVKALIEAVLQEDSLVYLGQTDSIGEFSITALPTGPYIVYAVLDRNNNGKFERRESFDSLTVTLDSNAAGEFWAIPHDTTGPRIRTLMLIDSITFSVEFNQSLAPGNPAASDVTVSLLPDSALVQISSVQIQAVFDSLRAAVRATADSVRRDSLATLDTTATDTTGVEPAVSDTSVTEPADPAGPEIEIPDTTRAMHLLNSRPALTTKWVVVVSQPMPPESRYLIGTNSTNVSGTSGESRSILIIPELPPPEPEVPPADVESVVLPEDTVQLEAVQEQADSS